MKDLHKKRAFKKGIGTGITERALRMLAPVFSLVLIASVAFGGSAAKYVSERNAPFGDEQAVDFTVNSVFVVDTADELFAAINQGYTYVQLDKSIENPLIITQKAENLNSDLILDLNGIEIQRNGYEPILNINEGVRLTVVDSSDEQTGGLYNPIGSVFNINGGTLTVVTGAFESGPRYSEYYSYNESVLDNSDGSMTKRTLVESDAQEVVYVKNGVKETVKAPIIRSYPTKTGDVTYNHGNLYFDETVKKGAVTLNADTYCYYRTSENAALGASDTTMADWYYTYYVSADTYEYTGPEAHNDDDIEVTIYGYERVIEQASEMTDEKDYYAAIQMSKGDLEVQYGSFYQYFGVDKTACVNAQGGTITVNQGFFSSRVPNATAYDTENRVSVKESDKKAFGSGYFNNFATGGLAYGGKSYCILNGGSATVKIGSGTLYSSNNSIISMQGGELSVGGGSFTKTLTKGLSADADKKQLSAINMQSGILYIEGSEFNVVGDNTYAIYSEVEGSDRFNIKSTDFTVTGDGCTGIYSGNGTVHITASSEATVKINGKEGTGIRVENGGSVESKNYSYSLTGEGSYGIYSSSGSVTIQNGKISLSSVESCYGIYAASDSKVTVTVDNSVIAVGCTVGNDGTPSFKGSDKTGPVKASVGVFLSSSNSESELKLTNAGVYCNELGIVSNGGAISLYGKGSITTDKASAIAIKNGSVSLDGGSDYTVRSSNTTADSSTNSYEMTLPVRNSSGDLTFEAYPNTDGIYVNGGSFTSKGQLTVTHKGLQNATPSNYDYSTLVVTSYAVRVYGGNVVIEKGKITAEVGGGIYAGKSGDKKGSIVLGSESLKNISTENCETANIVQVYTNGTTLGGEYNALGGNKSMGTWQSRKSVTGGHAVELDGGSITVYNGIYEAKFGNGVFVNGSSDKNEENGSIDIYNGSFAGYMTGVTGKTGPSAFYGLKVVGGAYVYIYGGEFYGGNGGAFVTGVTKVTDQSIKSSKTAYVYIYKGTFGKGTENTDAFNIYDDVEIVFGAYTKNELDGMFTEKEDIQKAISLNAKAASIAMNTITQSSSSVKESRVYIYYGTYNGKFYHDTDYDKTGKFNYYTYNLSESSGSYTVVNGNVLGDQNNTSATWFSGNGE